MYSKLPALRLQCVILKNVHCLVTIRLSHNEKKVAEENGASTTEVQSVVYSTMVIAMCRANS